MARYQPQEIFDGKIKNSQVLEIDSLEATLAHFAEEDYISEQDVDQLIIYIREQIAVFEDNGSFQQIIIRTLVSGSFSRLRKISEFFMKGILFPEFREYYENNPDEAEKQEAIVGRVKDTDGHEYILTGEEILQAGTYAEKIERFFDELNAWESQLRRKFKERQ